MSARKWLAIALIAVGVAILLFAPVAPMEFIVDMPADGRLPMIRDVKGGITPLGWVVFAAALAMVIAGVVFWFRKAR